MPNLTLFWYFFVTFIKALLYLSVYSILPDIFPICCSWPSLWSCLSLNLPSVTFISWHLLKFCPSRDVCNRLGTMASADFSSFVVTTASYSVSAADETSPSTTRFFPCIYLPHLLCTVPYSYWASVCLATLPPYIAWCDFCSSDHRFACTFLQIPPHGGHPWCSAVSFPLSGGFGTFTL